MFDRFHGRSFLGGMFWCGEAGSRSPLRRTLGLPSATFRSAGRAFLRRYFHRAAPPAPGRSV